MATVTGLTKERMLEIEGQSVVSGTVNGSGDLILTTHEGEQINAGNVKGPKGDTGPPSILLDAYPVGAVYISMVGTSPATLFGGTWAAMGQGRMLVGVNSSDTDFTPAGKTGGSKTHALTQAELPAHTHAAGTLATGANGQHDHNADMVNASGGPQTARFAGGSGTGNTENNTGVLDAGSHTHSITGSTGSVGSGTPHNNLPPYFAVHMWRRTA